MPPRNLNKSEKTRLRSASRDRTNDALVAAKVHLPNSEWLPPSNTYMGDCIGTLKNHLSSGGTLVQNDIAEYIAASAPAHAADGWNLLGRAVEATTRGDVHSAVHLAYYAELRAAMALLATEGIGIFQDDHVILTEKRKFKVLKGIGTHVATWLILDYWSGLRRSTDLLSRIIRPAGISLQDWLRGFGINTRAFGRKYFRSWGLDLRHLSKGQDREARNRSSYRPTCLSSNALLTAAECAKFVQEFWRLWEPSLGSSFEIDSYLLRLILWDTYGALPASLKGNFNRRVESLLASLSFSSDLSEKWRRFLIKETHQAEPMLFTEANKQPSSTDGKIHLQVIARASILLRVTSGACLELFGSAVITKNNIEFWWEEFGERHGIWDIGLAPDHLGDLWADIEESLMSLQKWETETGATFGYAKWRRSLPGEISVFSECERMGLWALIPGV